MRIKLNGILTLSLVFVAYQFGYAQVHLLCGTVDEDGYPLKVNLRNHKFVDNGSPYVVNVFYHFIKGNTFGEQNPEKKAEDMTILLNENFNKHNVFIRNSGYDIINNENYVSTTTLDFKTKLVNVNKKGNAINIYINKKHYNYKNKGLVGQANGILSKAFLVASDYTTGYTVPHELAHCLGLYHTYEKWQNIIEPKDGNQCGSLGDLVCDTPPDKKIR